MSLLCFFISSTSLRIWPALFVATLWQCSTLTSFVFTPKYQQAFWLSFLQVFSQHLHKKCPILILSWTREKDAYYLRIVILFSPQSPYPLVLPTNSWHVHLTFKQDLQEQEIDLLWAEARRMILKVSSNQTIVWFCILYRAGIPSLSTNPGSESDKWKILDEWTLIAGTSRFKALWKFWL